MILKVNNSIVLVGETCQSTSNNSSSKQTEEQAIAVRGIAKLHHKYGWEQTT